MNDITIQNILDIGNTALTDAKMIPLTKGYVTIVDVSDYDWLMQWKWQISPGNRDYLYAARAIKIPKTRRCRSERMHRLILNAPDKVFVDHINGDGLDNRRCNLRLCS